MFKLSDWPRYVCRSIELLPNKLLLGYRWNETNDASYCNLYVKHVKDNFASRIDSYAVCDRLNKTIMEDRFVVTNWDNNNGITYNHIYNHGDDYKVLHKWVENFTLTKESIINVFTRLLKNDQYDILPGKFLTKMDVMCIIHPLDTLDNDLL